MVSKARHEARSLWSCVLMGVVASTTPRTHHRRPVTSLVRSIIILRLRTGFTWRLRNFARTCHCASTARAECLRMTVYTADIPEIRSRWIAARQIKRTALFRIERARLKSFVKICEDATCDRSIARGVMLFMATLRRHIRRGGAGQVLQ